MSTQAVRRVHRLEPAALAGVMSRDVVMFGRYWKATTFSSVVQPVIYLLAFGLGFRSLVPYIGHVKYIEYLATGVVATAILFSSAFPGMFNTFVRWQFQRTYDAMLAAPVDTEELITAEVLWISLRAGAYGVAPLVVGMAFGLQPEPGMLLVPLIGVLTGFGFAAFGVLIAAVAKTIDNFNYVTSAVLTPMFLARSSRCQSFPTAYVLSRWSTRCITACSSFATPRSPRSPAPTSGTWACCWASRF
jgi:lipooligosaccharide transport system permease protein